MSCYAGPETIDSSMILCVDAANSKSYPGSGTSVLDMSGNNYTGTLTNGVTFSTNNLGVFVFDGTNDLITYSATVLDNITEGTISAWVYLNSVTAAAITARQRDGVSTYAVFSIGSYSASGGSATTGTAGKLYWHGKNGVTQAASTNNITANIWHHVVVTFNATQASFYINGAFDSTTAGDYVAGNSSGVLSPNYTQIGCWNNNGGTNFPLNGYIANLSVYNRVLGQSEVLQNYNATKGKFRPTLPTGGNISVIGSYRIHTFTSSSTFATNDFGGLVDYMIVAGGGGGGGFTGGGGGAGGHIYTPSRTLAVNTSYTVTVGGGGAGGGPGNVNGSNGTSSSFNSQTATAGGYGATNSVNGNTGGSGGGAGWGASGGSGTSGQGNNGGNGAGGAPNYGGGGGGGAGNVGANGTTTTGGTGGSGVSNDISGALTSYAGGGGGGTFQGGTAGTGGTGGGGNAPFGNGTANTGGGGGGSSDNSNTTAGGNGGSGIVIIRYKYPF